jgi:hypothetical protein
MKPVQPALTSNAMPFLAPSRLCSTQAVEGNGMSPVTVPTTIRSMSAGFKFASVSAFSQALRAMSDAASSGPDILRSFMPVRSTIHSSDVSIILSRSALVRMRSGTCMPVPARIACRG